MREPFAASTLHFVQQLAQAQSLADLRRRDGTLGHVNSSAARCCIEIRERSNFLPRETAFVRSSNVLEFFHSRRLIYISSYFRDCSIGSVGVVAEGGNQAETIQVPSQLKDEVTYKCTDRVLMTEDFLPVLL